MQIRASAERRPGLINEERPELGLSRNTTIQLLLDVPA
jgi:hypothetical protein